MISALLDRSPLARRLMVYVMDIALAGVSLVLSFFLRMGAEGERFYDALPGLIGIFCLIAAIVFPLSRLNSGSWRYASVRDLLAIVRAVTAAVLVLTLLLFLVDRGASLPRSVLVIEWFVLTILLAGPRLLYRLYRDSRAGRMSFTGNPISATPVLLYGFSDETETFIRAVNRDRNARFRAVGIVDPNSKHRGRQLRGVPVIGALEALVPYMEDARKRGTEPGQLIIARPNLDRAMLAEIVKAAARAGIKVTRLPNLQHTTSALSPETVKPQAVRLEDLLGRQPVVLDEAGISKFVSGRRVLITGAGGSVGSELAEQVLRFGAARITLLENSEFNLYEIERQLRRRPSQAALSPVFCDVRDRDRVFATMRQERPEIVFHAAALKHVPVLEQNPAEAALTNVFGTKHCADAAGAVGADAFIMISTDKAVRPTTILGHTKSLAESYCQMMDTSGSPTRFMTVRFGNVLGSRGSVVPLFEEQLQRGGPLTVTHPEITRYFMTSVEAAQLVLQASAYGLQSGQGSGRIFVLDMGQPVKIADLARNLVQLAGLKPDEDIRIEFVGLRPGEKLSEELFDDSENLEPTPVDGVLIATPRPVGREAVEERLTAILAALRTQEPDEVADLLRKPLRPAREVVRLTGAG